MRTIALLALVVAALACGAEPPPSCGAPGLVRACACVGGAAGAQECSPGGAWSVCSCPDGGAQESGVDAAADASPGADTGETGADTAPSDAAPDGPTCAPGFADCDGNAVNGCEADLRSSAAHCGRCGAACAAGANATPVCAAGSCGAVCNVGFADCNDQPGCETDVTTVLNCGGCGMSCPAGGGFRCCPNAAVNRCPRTDQSCQ